MKTSTKHQQTFKGLLTGLQGGLNKSVPPYAIGDEQLIDGTNVYYDPLSGYLTTRPGLKKYSAQALVGGASAWGGYSCTLGANSYDIVVGEDKGLYYLDDDFIPQLIGTLSGDKKPSFAVLNGLLVVASGGVLQTWDGVIGHALTDTASPTIDFITDYATKDTARIIGVGNATYPDRAFMSGSLDPSDWAFSATPEDDAKYIDLGYKDGLSVVAVGSLLGSHYYFKRSGKGHRRIYAANTTLPSINWTETEATRVNSTLSSHFVKELNNKLHFVDIEGPKTVSPQPAWDRPFPIDKSGQLIAATMRPYIADDGFSIVDPVFNLLMVKPSKDADTFFCLDVSGERWTYFKFAPNIQCGWYNGEKMLFGGNDGFIYEYDTLSCTDDGTPYQMSVETKWFDKNPMNLEIMTHLLIDLIGLSDGTVTGSINNKGAPIWNFQKTFSQGWWDWPTVNSITPENWTESLNKSQIYAIEDHEHVPANMMSINLTITDGLCSLIGIYGDISDSGKGDRG